MTTAAASSASASALALASAGLVTSTSASASTSAAAFVVLAVRQAAKISFGHKMRTRRKATSEGKILKYFFPEPQQDERNRSFE